MRVVSLVPSLSELVYYLQPEALVGRTRFCVYPTEIVQVDRIGGTKNVNITAVEKLRPDLILASKEENIREQVEALAANTRVEVFDIKNIEDALGAISQIGELLNEPVKALRLTEEINLKRAQFKQKALGEAVYLIWQKPWMTVGGDTYIHAMMEEAGFTNVFQSTTRYPTLTLEELVASQPRFLLLSSEPYPFQESDQAFFRKMLPNTHVLRVDGTYFSWYGSRLSQFYPYIQNLNLEVK